jgi:hypothetical protein
MLRLEVQCVIYQIISHLPSNFASKGNINWASWLSWVIVFNYATLLSTTHPSQICLLLKRFNFLRHVIWNYPEQRRVLQLVSYIRTAVYEMSCSVMVTCARLHHELAYRVRTRFAIFSQNKWCRFKTSVIPKNSSFHAELPFIIFTFIISFIQKLQNVSYRQNLTLS